MLEQKSERELIYMRDAGRVVAETHRELKNALRIGMTTKELDQIAEDYIRSKGAVPSFKGYSGYPASICASVNDVVVHGIPDERVLNGIAQAQVGNRLFDISHAVQKHVEAHGFSVVRDFCGHGIGREMHESPNIPNYGQPGHGPRLKAGYCLAIEPMVNVGTYEVSVLEDDWTTVTDDGELSAHFEHSIAVTDDGPIILTAL